MRTNADDSAYPQILRGPLGRIRARLGYSAPIRLWRQLRPTWLWRRTNPVGRATDALLRHHSLTISDGPFKGMRYPPNSVGHASYVGAKLIGSYERETYPAVHHALSHSVFVNVGAAEGYFAVGVAMRSPSTKVYAYELDRTGRRLMCRLAAANNCAVTVLGKCDPDALNRLPAENDVMLWVDVEGYERELLNPERVPMLRRATILVEQHADVDPAIPEVLDRRFADTHRAEVYRWRPRNREDFRALDDLSDNDAALVLLERLTSDQHWALYLPTAPTSSSRG